MGFWSSVVEKASDVYKKVDEKVFSGKLPGGAETPAQQSQETASEPTTSQITPSTQPTSSPESTSPSTTPDSSSVYTRGNTNPYSNISSSPKSTKSSGSSSSGSSGTSSPKSTGSSSSSSISEKVAENIHRKVTGKALSEEISKAEEYVKEKLPQKKTTKIIYDEKGNPVLTSARENIISHSLSRINAEANKPYHPDMTTGEQIKQTGAGVANIGVGAVESIYGFARHPIQSVKGLLNPKMLVATTAKNFADNPTKTMGNLAPLVAGSVYSYTHVPKVKVTSEVSSTKTLTHTTDKGSTIGITDSKFVVKSGGGYYKYRVKASIHGNKINEGVSVVSGHGKVLTHKGEIRDFTYAGVTKENTITHLHPDFMLQKQKSGTSTTHIHGKSVSGEHQSVSIAKKQHTGYIDQNKGVQVDYFVTQGISTSKSGVSHGKGITESIHILKKSKKSDTKSYSQGSTNILHKTKTKTVQNIESGAAGVEIAKEIAKEHRKTIEIRKQDIKTQSTQVITTGSLRYNKVSTYTLSTKSVVVEQDYRPAKPPTRLTESYPLVKTKIPELIPIVSSTPTQELLQDTKSDPIQKTIPKEIPSPIYKNPLKEAPKPILENPLKQTPKPLLKNVQKQQTGSSLPSPNPHLRNSYTPRIPAPSVGFRLPKFTKRANRGVAFSTRSTTQQTRYNPSFTALVTETFGKPSKAGTLSGLGIRPIQKKKKKSRGFRF